ncbi:MAG: SDR family oxidoreductase [Xanthomonadales bacterium]|nr:SDR family oxidoreductase [Xanthomonadales bacterium]
MNARWRLDGKIALVTGASKGIGLAAARELALLGCDVLLVARDAATLEARRAEIEALYPKQRALAFAADLAEAEQRLDLFDWINDLGRGLDVLVNNVGGNSTRATLDYELDEVRRIFELNVITAFDVCRMAHPLLARHGEAAIVNVGSVSGLTAVRTGSPYGMSKAALTQLTRNLAIEWADHGIRVNAVAPWYIRTQRTEGKLANPEYLAEVVAHTPLGRIGEPEEVAAVIAFLCLPAASYVTGETVAVDGGFLRDGF